MLGNRRQSERCYRNIVFRISDHQVWSRDRGWHGKMYGNRGIQNMYTIHSFSSEWISDMTESESENLNQNLRQKHEDHTTLESSWDHRQSSIDRCHRTESQHTVWIQTCQRSAVRAKSNFYTFTSLTYSLFSFPHGWLAMKWDVVQLWYV